MVHTGKPSGACKACKERHRKCDEARPACGLCLKSKRTCPGYSEGLDLVLRDQTVSAKTAVERRQKKFSRNNSPLSTIPGSPVELEETHAMGFFVSSYVFHPRDTRTDRGFFELIAYFLPKLRQGTPLDLALNAVAVSFYAAWERRARDFETPTLSAAYGKALKATRIAISDPIACMTDETLMAVCLLGIYEEGVSSYRAQISPVRHYSGAAALITQRNGCLASDLYKKLMVAVRSAIVFRAMDTGSPIDTMSILWHETEDMPQNPTTILDLMSVEVANVLAFEKSDASTGSSSNVLGMARIADKKLATWPSLVPLDWQPVQIPRYAIPKSVQDAGVYGDGCDIYSDVLVCSAWNTWRTARLRILALMAKYESEKSTLSTIQQLVDSICATFPFLLGDRRTPAPLFAANVEYPSKMDHPVPATHHQMAASYGGWYMLTPLRQAISVGMYLREGQLQWIRSQGSRLANIYDVSVQD